MTNKNLIERLKRECDRHVIGYPGPRREVAELIDEAAALIEQQEALICQLSEALEFLFDPRDEPRLIRGKNDKFLEAWRKIRASLLASKTHLDHGAS